MALTALRGSSLPSGPASEMGLAHLLAGFGASLLALSAITLGCLDGLSVLMSKVRIALAALPNARALDRAETPASNRIAAYLTRVTRPSIPLASLRPYQLRVSHPVGSRVSHLFQILRAIIERVLILVVDSFTAFDCLTGVCAKPDKVRPSNVRPLDPQGRPLLWRYPNQNAITPSSLDGELTFEVRPVAAIKVAALQVGLPNLGRYAGLANGSAVTTRLLAQFSAAFRCDAIRHPVPAGHRANLSSRRANERTLTDRANMFNRHVINSPVIVPKLASLSEVA